MMPVRKNYASLGEVTAPMSMPSATIKHSMSQA